MADYHSTSKTIRVLLIEDHGIVREGVCALLEKESDIQVVGSVGSGEEGLEFLQQHPVDIVVVDVGLPGISGVEVTRRIRESDGDVGILALTAYSDEQYLLGMLDAGASGYLLKRALVGELVAAIRVVNAGQYFLDPSVARIVIETSRKYRQRVSATSTLTDREKDVLILIGQGRTSREIAKFLRLSPKTVENYRARILGKLQVKNCSEAVSKAIKQQLIELSA